MRWLEVEEENRKGINEIKRFFIDLDKPVFLDIVANVNNYNSDKYKVIISFIQIFAN